MAMGRTHRKNEWQLGPRIDQVETNNKTTPKKTKDEMGRQHRQTYWKEMDDISWGQAGLAQSGGGLYPAVESRQLKMMMMRHADLDSTELGA